MTSEASVEYSTWKDETELNQIMLLIEKDLSEPYSIFTYRYFIRTWPDLCIIVSSLFSYYRLEKTIP
jgi:peptide alpha-N-acetyltransferase